MTESRYIILIDIDHVISDAAWRDHMIDNTRTSNDEWDEYHHSGRHDKPHNEIVELLRQLTINRKYFIVGLTSRPERWRKQTMEWMLKFNVPMDDLLMRPDKSYEPSAKLKVEQVKEHFNLLLHQIAFVIDDREDIVEAFRAINVNVFQYFMRRS